MRTLQRILLLALLPSIPVFPQTTSTGTVLGLVSDPAGAAVPAATVHLQDTATNVVRSATTNIAGRYVFVGVPPGTYSVKVAAQGFQQAVVPSVFVEVGKSYTVNLELKVGEILQTIEVASTPGIELQTLDSTISNIIGGDTLLFLPTLQRNVTGLLLLQPTAMPQQGPDQNSTLGGQVAGARSDQNSIVLDGGSITNTVSGNSDYYTNFRGGQEGPIPTPVASIQEFRVATSNHTASFSGASGSETVLVTRRGSNNIHGSLYEAHQNDDLNANRWDRNRLRQKRPESKDNRFGASLGGYIPGLPEARRTFFFANYEGRRLVNTAQISRTVPSDALRQGILRFRDASGNIISYNLAASQQCGPQGNQACDPRGTGMSPLIRGLWDRYLPPGNDVNLGDGLNTIGFSGPVRLPVHSDFGVLRLDHSFGSNWQVMGSYRYYSEDAAVTRQLDIGGLTAGHTKGVAASTATIPRQPRYVALSATGILRPNVTSESIFSFLRDWWSWRTSGALPQVPGTAAALNVGGMVPVNLDVGGTRTRTWSSRSGGFRENLSWQKSTHLMRFGGTFDRTAVAFNRDDSQIALVQPVYQVTQTSGIVIPTAYRPPTCTAGLTTNCLPASQVTTWNQLYAQVLGMVDSAAVLGTRDSDLMANPAGTPLFNNVTYDNFSLYFNDSWNIVRSLTLSFGLNWSVELPPTEDTGKQALSLDPDNRPIIPGDFLERRRQAALSGQVYNPLIGFAPVGFTKRKYPYDPAYDTAAPRIALAWTPETRDGVLGRIFGDRKTVFRGGYARLFDRLNGVQKAINPLQGLGFGQAIQCLGPSSGGQCRGNAGTDPATGFRIGIDGSAVPIPPISASATPPLTPGVSGLPGANQPFAQSTFQIDPHYRPSRSNQWNFTMQRELPGRSLIEIGYVRRTATQLYSPIELNQAPFFMTLGDQTFAQAFDAVAAQLRAGAAVAPQGFFERALAGSTFCAAPNASCTAGVASRFSGSFLNQRVTELWNGVQSSFVFGPATAAPRQVGTYFFWASKGFANYNAGFVSYRTRGWKGLTLDANFTYGHSLDTAGLNQDYDTAASNSYNLRYDYGTSLFDRKYVFNLLGMYELPFARGGGGFLSQLARGWVIAPIFTAYTGLPLRVVTGSGQEFGQGGNTRGAGAILLTRNTFGNTLHSSITGNARTQVAINGDPARGGSGLNLFSDPDAVFGSFRPTMISLDTTSNGGGQLRGLNRWNLDLTVARKLKITERWTAHLSAQFFNFFNHVLFDDPAVNLQRPQTFGVVSSQLNSPRIIQLALGLAF